MAPHVYTIAPDRPFLATVARGLVGVGRRRSAAAAADDRAAADAARGACAARGVPAPDRRGRRSRSAVAVAAPAPDRRPRRGRDRARRRADRRGRDLGPPALPDLRRRLLLARLVLGWSAAAGRAAAAGTGRRARRRAGPPARQAAASDGASRGCASWCPPTSPSTGGSVLSFLDILPRAMAGDPRGGRRARSGRAAQPAARRSEQWRKNPPRGSGHRGRAGRRHPGADRPHVARSPGSTRRGDPAGARPRLDAMNGADREDPSHPQHLTRALLRDLETRTRRCPRVARAGTELRHSGARTAAALVAQALRPAGAERCLARAAGESAAAHSAGLSRVRLPEPARGGGDDRRCCCAARSKRRARRRRSSRRTASWRGASPRNCGAGTSRSTIPPACRSTARRPAPSCASCRLRRRTSSRRSRCWPRSSIRSPPAGYARGVSRRAAPARSARSAARARRRALPGCARR